MHTNIQGMHTYVHAPQRAYNTVQKTGGEKFDILMVSGQMRTVKIYYPVKVSQCLQVQGERQ